MQNLVFLTDRFDGHGAGAGIGPEDGPYFVSQDQVLGLTDGNIRLGVGIPDEKFDRMLFQETALGIDLLHCQLDGIHTVLAIQGPGPRDGQSNPEVVGFGCLALIQAGHASKQNERTDNDHKS